MDNEFVRQHLNAMPPGPGEHVDEALGHLVEKLQFSKDGKLTGCTSYIQRKLQCGYNHAAAIMEIMEERGLITNTDDRGARRLIDPKTGRRS